MTVKELLATAARDLAALGIPTPRLDAEVLLGHALGVRRLDLHLDPDRGVDVEGADAFAHLVAARGRGCPVAYLTGRKEFFSLEFLVDPTVLIPRAETEHVVEEALRIASALRNRAEILALDIGTGSGAIAVAFAHEEPRARIVAVDITAGALATARRNAQRHGVADRIAFLQADLLDALLDGRGIGRFDLVLSNPPYVPDAEFDRLPGGVRDFEPASALRSGPDPFHFHRRLARDARGCLRAGGSIVLEIGAGVTTDPTDALGVLTGYEDVRWLADLAGRPRVLAGRLPNP